MTDREKVIECLWGISAYFRESFDAMSGTNACELFRQWSDAAEHAIALLKSQEPRVMTLDEVKALPSETDVWLDEFCSIIVAATISCALYGNAYFYGIEHADYGVDYRLADYGKEWRCWTSRPTYEQREAEPWETGTMNGEK